MLYSSEIPFLFIFLIVGTLGNFSSTGTRNAMPNEQLVSCTSIEIHVDTQ